MSKTENLQYNKLNNDGVGFIAVFVPGHDLQSARDDHPYYDKIVELAEADDPSVIELFNIAKTVGAKFERLSERIAVRNGTIYLDGDEINNALTQQILRFIDAGEDFAPLVNFFEKVLANPVDHSREQLFRFLDANGLVISITEDGDIVAYKGMVKVTDESGEVFYTPSSHGAGNPVIIDGVEYADSTSHDAKQVPGSVVELPRSVVVHDPHTHCSVGLHIATFAYAKSYGDVIVEVRVNPRDVVSVPNDSREKVRACRYTIIGERDSRHEQVLVRDQVPTPDPLPDTETLYPEASVPQAGGQEGVNDLLNNIKPAGGSKPDQTQEVNAVTTTTARKRYPKPAQFEELLDRAKRRKQGAQKFIAQNQPTWTFHGTSPSEAKERKNWTIN